MGTNKRTEVKVQKQNIFKLARGGLSWSREGYVSKGFSSNANACIGIAYALSYRKPFSLYANACIAFTPTDNTSRFSSNANACTGIAYAPSCRKSFSFAAALPHLSSFL